LGNLRRTLREGDAVGIAVGVAIGLAVFYAVATVVTSLLFQVVAVFIGDSEFDLNSFTIKGAEFKYGVVIEYLAVVAIVVGLGLVYRSWVAKSDDGAGGSRSCPECTMSIPSKARRCPHCTAVVPGD
jgi:large conductance mechanosensitive channel